jgi:hypothetical protein
VDPNEGVVEKSKSAMLPSSPPDIMSFVDVLRQYESMTFDELWWMRTGCCQARTKVVDSAAGCVPSEDRGQMAVCPSVPAVKRLSVERNEHCVRQDVK